MVKRFRIILAAVFLAVKDVSSDAASEADPSADPFSVGYSPYFSYSQHHSHPPPIPACAENTTKSWCLQDSEYPTYDIKHAATHHYYAVLSLFKDVALNTENSVELSNSQEGESYLCPSETSYVQPLRALNVDGKWRTIVNNVKVHYETLTQFARLEECSTADEACQLVPACYESKCLQKHVYQRFLIYEPYDYYFPFAVETFKLPASCACFIGSYSL